MRILGLDVGEKRIGVAVCDPLGITAQGLKTIYRDKKNDIEEIKKLIIEYNVDKIIVGLPKNMNNTIGPQSEKVMRYAENIQKKCDIKIEYFDERLSTMAVERTLIEADIRREDRRKVIDKLAAVYILQSYLDTISKIQV